MRRKICRERIFKLLFQVEFNDKEEYPALCERFHEFLPKPENSEDEFVTEDPEEEEVKEIILDEDEEKYVSEKFDRIVEKIDELDRLLNETSEEWKTARMGKVELAILRLALYEMREDDDIPESVAINEAVELAKKYGSDEAYAFVNGVLAKCAKNTEGRKEAVKKDVKNKPWKKGQKAKIVVKGSSSSDT